MTSLSLIIRDAKNDGRKALEILRKHYLSSSETRVIGLFTELTTLKKEEAETLTDYVLRGETAAKWNIRRETNWESYEANLNRKMDDWNMEMGNGGDNDIIKAYDNLVALIISAAEEEIGTKTFKQKFTTSTKLKRAEAKRIIARNKWRVANLKGQKNTNLLWENYKVTAKKVRNIGAGIRRKMRNKWLTRVSKEGGLSSRVLWREIKTKEKELTALKTNNGVVTNIEDLKEVVVNHYKELGAIDDGEENNQQDRDESNETIEYISDDLMEVGIVDEGGLVYLTTNGKNNKTEEGKEGGEGKNPEYEGEKIEEISIEEVKDVIKGMKNNKAAGDDDIKYEFLKKGGEKLTKGLVIIFNMMLKEKTTPESWNTEGVTLIFKGGDRQNISNYRGIAISNTLGKIFAKILANRISKTAEEKDWLGENQAAFRKNRGVEDHLFTLNWIWEKSRLKRESLYITFIDLKKAYDSVYRDILWESLKQIGVQQEYIEMVKCLYINHRRYIRVKDQKTETIVCNRGLRQGCPLSPILFAILISTIPEETDKKGRGVLIGGSNISCLLYADDIVLINRTEEDMKKNVKILMEEVNKKK